MTPFAPTEPAQPPSSVHAALNDPALLDRLTGQVLARLNVLLNDKSRVQRRQEAEEIVSEAMKRALEKQDDFEPTQGDLGAWLHGFLTRVTSEFCRKLRKRPLQPPADLDAPESPPDQVPDFRLLSAMLNHLSPEDRAIVEDYHLRGYSHREIAGRLGISEGTARQRARRALNKLRQRAVGEDQR